MQDTSSSQPPTKKQKKKRRNEGAVKDSDANLMDVDM
jgi:hypothetical protein